jgi:hypothetical protein
MRKLILVIIMMFLASCANTKCVGALHKSKYKHKHTCAAFR